jgi:hypothetical protein
LNGLSKKKLTGGGVRKSASKRKVAPSMGDVGPPIEMPVLSEEYLNQLNEDQLQALLE